MIIIFIVMAVIVILVLAYILLSRQGGRMPPEPIITPKDKKPHAAESVSSSTGNTPTFAPHHRQQNDDTSSDDEDSHSRSDVYAEQKLFLKTGIENIFSGHDGMSVERSIPLRHENIEKDLIRAIDKQIGDLNSFRTEQIRLQKMLDDSSSGISHFSKIVISDPMLTAVILRTANSSYLSMGQKIDSISHALMILGLQNIKNIIYHERMRLLFQPRTQQQAEMMAGLWYHSSITSSCSSFLCDLFDGLNMGTLFTLAIIHDMGKLVILELPQTKTLQETFWERYPADISIWEEDRLLGVNHEVIGGMALKQWNFSESMVKIIQMHHAPAYIDASNTGLSREDLKYVVALFIAAQIAKLFPDRQGGTVAA